MSVYSWLKGSGPSGFGYGSSAEQVLAGADLAGKVYLITGCNSGIGHESMRALAQAGATVLGAARSTEKAQAACDAVPGDTRPVVCELADPASVRAAVQAVQGMGLPLDGIITNAGIMALAKRELLFGVEKQMFVNHVGHFMLVTGLLDRLADTGRVVCLSSAAHEIGARVGFDPARHFGGGKTYQKWVAYGRSKLANLLFAVALTERFEGTGKTACAVHPGVIDTELGRHSLAADVVYKLTGPLFLKSVPQGAATQVWAAAVAEPGQIQGQYLADCNVAKAKPLGQDRALAADLWAKTQALVDTLPA